MPQGPAHEPLPEPQPEPLSNEYLRSIAHLSRLAMDDSQLPHYRATLSETLDYIARLNQLNLDGVEPLVAIGDAVATFPPDSPGPMLTNNDLMRMAPSSRSPFVTVPKVLTDSHTS